MIGKTSSVTVTGGRDGYPVEANTFNEMYVGIQNEEIGRIFLWNPPLDPISGDYPSSPWTVGKKYEVITFYSPTEEVRINIPTSVTGSARYAFYSVLNNNRIKYNNGATAGVHVETLTANTEYWLVIQFSTSSSTTGRPSTIAYNNVNYSFATYQYMPSTTIDTSRIQGAYGTIPITDANETIQPAGFISGSYVAVLKIRTAPSSPQIAHQALEGGEVITWGQ